MMKLTPKLSVRSADEAIAFYRRALGATCPERYTAQSAVIFCRVVFEGAELEIKDADSTDRGIQDLGGSPILFTLEVEDAAAAVAAMVDAGASVRFELAEQVYGYRQGRVVDPFGVQWIISERTEELTSDEVQSRVDAAFG